MDITHNALNVIKENIIDDCIIFLSGPSSSNTSIKLLHSKNVIAVNGSMAHLIDNNIPVLAYVVCDGSFYKNNKFLFYKYSAYAKYTFISENVIKKASPTEQKNLLNTCFLLNDLCKSRGGIGRKLRYTLKYAFNKNVFIKCSMSRKVKTLAFSTDISYGHYGSATVAFSALQLAITLKFKRIFFSGLDLVGNCERFYSETVPQPTALPKDFDFILKSFKYLTQKYLGEIYNLSNTTAIPYQIIPFMSEKELMN